jgi:hypothetical protein
MGTFLKQPSCTRIAPSVVPAVSHLPRNPKPHYRKVDGDVVNCFEQIFVDDVSEAIYVVSYVCCLGLIQSQR